MLPNRPVVGLISIKDHSERVVAKSFRLFGGKPVYPHVIHALARACAVDRTIIKTE